MLQDVEDHYGIIPASILSHIIDILGSYDSITGKPLMQDRYTYSNTLQVAWLQGHDRKILVIFLEQYLEVNWQQRDRGRFYFTYRTLRYDYSNPEFPANLDADLTGLHMPEFYRDDEPPSGRSDDRY